MDFNNFFWAINTKNIKKLGLLKYIQIESELWENVVNYFFVILEIFMANFLHWPLRYLKIACTCLF